MLNDIRVLDLTNVLAGPFCCHQLAHMGAEVIKIEAVGRGDLARQLGPDARLNQEKCGISFLAQNAGKKSLTLNLKSPEGKSIFRKLVETADVVVENFRPGVMDRLGLGYKQLQQVNPQIVYCAISGFGQEGPFRERPAYDQIVQGLSGVMTITGRPGDEPLRVGYPLADTIGGLTAAMAISAALNSKPRGAFLDVAMLDSVLTSMGWIVSNFLNADIIPGQHGNENMTSSPSGTFQTQEGLLNIAANEERQWQALAEHLGCGHLCDDDRFRTREQRKKYRTELRQELEKSLATKPAKQWEDELCALGVPAGIVMTVPEMLAHEQIRQRGLIAEFPSPIGEEKNIALVRTGFLKDGSPVGVTTPPPRLGENNEDLLYGLGYGENEINEFYQKGVI